MQEEYQSNWFNQKGENKNLTNLFQEARKQDYNSLIRNTFTVDKYKEGQLELVEFLLKNAATLGIDLNATDTLGMTAFMNACEGGHADVAKVLMENSTTSNIDLNAKDSLGWTAFIRACRYGKTSIVELMLDSVFSSEIKLQSICFVQHQLHNACLAK